MAKAKKSVLNDKKEKIITEEILKENPAFLEEAHIDEPAIVTAKYVPQMETIIFRNDRDPGVPLEFHYSSKTHHLQRFKLLHGGEYTLPVEIVEHLESRSVPIYGYRRGPDGHPEMFIQSYKNLFSCKVVRKAA